MNYNLDLQRQHIKEHDTFLKFLKSIAPGCINFLLYINVASVPKELELDVLMDWWYKNNRGGV